MVGWTEEAVFSLSLVLRALDLLRQRYNAAAITQKEIFLTNTKILQPENTYPFTHVLKHKTSPVILPSPSHTCLLRHSDVSMTPSTADE
jgi:hypothetical protein